MYLNSYYLKALQISPLMVHFLPIAKGQIMRFTLSPFTSKSAVKMRLSLMLSSKIMQRYGSFKSRLSVCLANQVPMIKPSIKPLISEVKSRLCKLAKTKFKTLSNTNAPLYFFGVIISKKGDKK